MTVGRPLQRPIFGRLSVGEVRGGCGHGHGGQANGLDHVGHKVGLVDAEVSADFVLWASSTGISKDMPMMS